MLGEGKIERETTNCMQNKNTATAGPSVEIQNYMIFFKPVQTHASNGDLLIELP